MRLLSVYGGRNFYRTCLFRKHSHGRSRIFRELLILPSKALPKLPPTHIVVWLFWSRQYHVGNFGTYLLHSILFVVTLTSKPGRVRTPSIAQCKASGRLTVAQRSILTLLRQSYSHPQKKYLFLPLLLNQQKLSLLQQFLEHRWMYHLLPIPRSPNFLRR